MQGASIACGENLFGMQEHKIIVRKAIKLSMQCIKNFLRFIDEWMNVGKFYILHKNIVMGCAGLMLMVG